MDIINRFKSKYSKLARRNDFKMFMKFGAPMFIFTIGGVYVIEEFQKVRMEYKNNKEDQQIMNDMLAQKGINKVDMKAEYERIQRADTSNYRNIRGPRPYENNVEFLKNRELQEKRLAQILGKDVPQPESVTSQ